VCEPCVNQPRGKSEHHGKCSAFLLRLQQQQQQQLQQYGREEEDEDEEEEDNTAIPSTTASHLQLIKSSTLADVKSPIRLPENNASEDLSPLGLYRSETNDEEVAVGVAQLAAFQVVLIFTAVAAILALTCRLRVFSSHEPTRLKVYLTV